jgi:iron-sulfur cluster repair protein YtfE (RIC family)
MAESAVHALPESATTHAESVTQIFGLDHRRLDAIFAAAKQSLHAGNMRAGIARFSEFRDGLERHIVAEETVLFPLFETITGSADGPTRVMRLEHEEIRRLLVEIASKLERNGGEGLMTPLAALTARIYAHNGKEERILYPWVDRAARDAGESEALLRRVREAGL